MTSTCEELLRQFVKVGGKLTCNYVIQKCTLQPIYTKESNIKESNIKESNVNATFTLLHNMECIINQYIDPNKLDQFFQNIIVRKYEYEQDEFTILQPTIQTICNNYNVNKTKPTTTTTTQIKPTTTQPKSEPKPIIEQNKNTKCSNGFQILYYTNT